MKGLIRGGAPDHKQQGGVKKEHGQWIKVSPGSPRETEQRRDAVCVVALLATGLFSFLGCIALLSSNPQNEETGYRMLRVAEVTGDVANTVCRC